MVAKALGEGERSAIGFLRAFAGKEPMPRPFGLPPRGRRATIPPIGGMARDRSWSWLAGSRPAPLSAPAPVPGQFLTDGLAERPVRGDLHRGCRVSVGDNGGTPRCQARRAGYTSPLTIRLVESRPR